MSARAVSHPLAVRETLATLLTGMTAWDLETAQLNRVELVLAEALNNVFEHACGCANGIPFSAKLRYIPPDLWIDITDQGAAMSGFALPRQADPNAPLPRLDVPRQALPEGGWGWIMIRDLTESLHYQRGPDGNHLHIHMRVPRRGQDTRSTAT